MPLGLLLLGPVASGNLPVCSPEVPCGGCLVAALLLGLAASTAELAGSSVWPGSVGSAALELEPLRHSLRGRGCSGEGPDDLRPDLSFASHLQQQASLLRGAHITREKDTNCTVPLEMQPSQRALLEMLKALSAPGAQ